MMKNSRMHLKTPDLIKPKLDKQGKLTEIVDSRDIDKEDFELVARYTKYW